MDFDEVKKEVSQINIDSKDYINLINELVKPHTAYLDSLIDEAIDLTKTQDYLIDMLKLQSLYIKLSGEIYHMLDKLKDFEANSSIAKGKEIEIYNNAYLEESLNRDKKPTINELQIKAQLKSEKISVASLIYNSAFKNIKAKIEKGDTFVDTLKNILKNKISMDYKINTSSSDYTN